MQIAPRVDSHERSTSAGTRPPRERRPGFRCRDNLWRQKARRRSFIGPRPPRGSQRPDRCGGICRHVRREPPKRRRQSLHSGTDSSPRPPHWHLYLPGTLGSRLQLVPFIRIPPVDSRTTPQRNRGGVQLSERHKGGLGCGTSQAVVRDLYQTGTRRKSSLSDTQIAKAPCSRSVRDSDFPARPPRKKPALLPERSHTGFIGRCIVLRTGSTHKVHLRHPESMPEPASAGTTETLNSTRARERLQ